MSVPVGEDWRTSSRSIANGECVETATVPSGVLVRDTRDRDGLVLAFGTPEWAAFTAGLKGGAA